MATKHQKSTTSKPLTVAPTPSRLIDPRSPDHRESAICAAVSDLITAGDVHEAIEAIRRGLKAQTTIRAPKKPGSETRNDYLVVDDVPSQLAAVRLLLAYKFGNPASVVEMKLTTGETDRKPPTREEMVAALQRSGTDINAIIGTWLGAAKKVEETGALPADLAETRRDIEQISVIDV